MGGGREVSSPRGQQAFRINIAYTRRWVQWNRIAYALLLIEAALAAEDCVATQAVHAERRHSFRYVAWVVGRREMSSAPNSQRLQSLFKYTSPTPDVDCIRITLSMRIF